MEIVLVMGNGIGKEIKIVIGIRIRHDIRIGIRNKIRMGTGMRFGFC